MLIVARVRVVLLVVASVQTIVVVELVVLSTGLKE